MALVKSEVLVPRSSMIETAVNFLQNPQVHNTSILDKKAFLKKKGLTDEEIDIAIQKAGDENANYMQHPSSGPLVIQKPSLWLQMRRMSSALMFFVLSAYGLHYFYKLYLEPLMFGYQRKSRLDALQQQIIEVHHSIGELRRAVADMELSIRSQKDEVNSCLKTLKSDQELMLNPITLGEVQAEIGTIKSLLLSRHQFPDAPKIYPSIPSWQLPSISEKASEKCDKVESNNPENSVEVLQCNQTSQFVNEIVDEITNHEVTDEESHDDEISNEKDTSVDNTTKEETSESSEEEETDEEVDVNMNKEETINNFKEVAAQS